MNIDQVPYPVIQVEAKNPQYAKELLGNIGGVDSEMTAVGMYFHGHLVAWEHPELSRTFQRISMAEMRHLEIFGTLAMQLGADPRLWERAGRRPKYWSPKYIEYAVKPKKIITNALISEHMTVEKYTKQAKAIRDENIVENLNRIIQDEKEHIRILTELLGKV